MHEQPKILVHLLHLCEFIALVAGIIKFKSLKNSYWKWFVFYLAYIFVYEIISYIAKAEFKSKIGYFQSYIHIPIEYLFLFWLFAVKSLQKRVLFYWFSVLFFLSFVIDARLQQGDFTIKSLNTTIGNLLLLILVMLEFNKQIKSDAILNFKENKMFYINIGVTLFYVGNMPFFGWYMTIYQYPSFWNGFYKYFMISNCIMYLLFAASFVWGKVKS
ncbi:hypothetical protein [Flavobacterium sp.]|uniref:hypothetical protein n=1 Tax=Flavobacterium sp. TaxID=239 RepID=UPI002606C3B9|nr:hypothetical protein [Flavobacterium sp.]